MENSSGMDIEFELLCVIVNFGSGTKVMKIAKQSGISGGTFFLGKGTIKNRLLEFLDLCDIRKEIVFMVSEKTTAYHALEVLAHDLAFHKPNHGIGFAISAADLLGARSSKSNHIKQSRGVENTMYNAIFVVVDKGRAEDVIEAATKAGSRGGTIINARGSGIHETNMLFSMPIEPEKEIVMILSETNLTDSIVASIGKDLEIETPGNGVMFILDINKAYGLY